MQRRHLPRWLSCQLSKSPPAFGSLSAPKSDDGAPNADGLDMGSLLSTQTPREVMTLHDSAEIADKQYR
eukprot:2138043-Pyramimonas_sp.AAC.2